MYYKGYDEDFFKIDHYKVYKELLPYIGLKYNLQKSRILFIGESHYVISKIKKQVDDSYYNDREILQKFYENTENYICDLDTRREATKPKRHNIHNNIEKVLKLNGLNYSEISFYNFFQKPAFSKKSLVPTDKDIFIANLTFKTICNIIKPNLVFFVSAKSFELLKNKEQYNFKIHKICHPTCKWWNKPCKYGKKGGRGKLIELLNQVLIHNASPYISSSRTEILKFT